MYGLLITATGWTWEYIDQRMTMPRYFKLMGYWMNHPPAHLTLRAIIHAFGGEKESTPAKVQARGIDNVKEDTSGLMPMLLRGKAARVTRKKPPKWPTKTS